jgi:hypothetical protein
MMKDPRYAETEEWVDISLALRIHLQSTTEQFQSAIEAFEGSEQSSNSIAEAVIPSKIKFSRASETNVTTLRNLPSTTSILLFTPVILPAGHPAARKYDRATGKQGRNCLDVQKAFERQQIRTAQTQKLGFMQETETVDPFEAFGRALSTYHRRIRHVPYVAKVGFTATHDTFVSEADAVITVVCEPDIDKDRSVSDQMNFAEAALDSLERKEACAANALVLVQCGANQYRLPIDAMFMNVIECQNYDAESAKSIARTVFEAGI